MKTGPIYREIKNGQTAEFRNATAADAQLYIDYLKRVCGESPYLSCEAEEVSLTLEGEKLFLSSYENADRALMLGVYINGAFAGNGSFEEASTSARHNHRAILSIALYREYTNQGIGKIMLEILLEEASKCGYEIMELEVYAGNTRAIHLYEKMGFEKCGCRKNAIKYKDGSYDDEILMQKFL